MMNNTQYLFGLPAAACQTPLGTSLALELAPQNALGAELLAVADEFVKSDPEHRDYLRYEVAKYRIALWASPSIVRMQKEEVIRKVNEASDSLWSQVVQNVGQIPWAVSGGLFATPRFFHSASFKPPFDLTNLNISPSLHLHFSTLENEGLILVKILEKIVVSLASANTEEAEIEMGTFRNLADHVGKHLGGYSPPGFNDSVIHRFYNQKFLNWFAGLLDQAKIVWSRFNKIDPELHQMRGAIRHLEAKILVEIGQKEEAAQAFRKMTEANVLAGIQLEGEDITQSVLHYRNAARALRREAQMVQELGDETRAEEARWESAELFGKTARMFRLLENDVASIRARMDQMTLLGILRKRREAAQNWEGVLEIVSKQLEVLEGDLENLQGVDESLHQLTRNFYTTLKQQKQVLQKRQGEPDATGQ